ncbi:MAG TPA: DUF1592 domain-containing protein [Polyangiaceae bacterium]|nr:DUF1592 domain-containing protein [Polyangiaceae bacterium]
MKVLSGAAILALLCSACSGTIAESSTRSRTTGGGGAGNDNTTGTNGTTTATTGAGGATTGSGGGATTGSGGGAGTAGSGGQGGTGGTPPPPTGTDPGRVTLHRLNRVEYNNTVRDLLGTARAPADDFPIDDRGSGFDNIADVLTLSPLHVDNYYSAAVALVDEALVTATQRSKLVTCDLVAQGATCARKVLDAFVPLAWRRPVVTTEVDALMASVTLATTQGDAVEQGLKIALRSVLMSPNFIFRVENDPSPASPAAHPLGQYEIASRLSYFIWSSMPDTDLFAAAKAGTLSQTASLQTQVTRMLASPKAAALSDNFAGQWLYTRQIADAAPDPKLFPTFDDSLRTAMKLEVEAMFREVVANGMPADKLLTADFTFANDRLAKHYGLPAVGSATPVKVSLAGTARGGILSQGAFLTVTSHQNRTSPVLRGKWILNQLLCLSVPPPPPDVNVTLDPAKSTGTLRQQMEAHRANPACATCHKQMDPIGLGLENYDAIGTHRTTDQGLAIDSSGELPDGRQFNGAQQLATLVATDANFGRCMTEQLYTYALGRSPDTATAGHMDPAVLYGIAQSFRTNSYSFKDLVTQIATSPTFLNRRGEP